MIDSDTRRDQSTSFLFGPAGWSYQDWLGTVYPAGAGRDFDQLAFIAGQSDFIEVNSTFYRLPSARQSASWVERTAAFPGFSFWIKAYRGFSHERQPMAGQTRVFLEALRPLAEAGKLAGILLQFPYSFHCRRHGLDYLAGLGDAFSGLPLAVEFRHASWNQAGVLNFFRERCWIFVNVDQPRLSANLPLTCHVTNDHVTYFRLHGRNAGSWFSGAGRDARYDYLYSESEISSIAGLLRGLAGRVARVFVVGNNHYRGQAMINLRQLKSLLRLARS